MNISFILNSPKTCGGRQKTCFKLAKYLAQYHSISIITDEKYKFLYDNIRYLKSSVSKSDIIILISSFNSLNIWIKIAKDIKKPFIYSEHCARDYVLKRWSAINRYNLINVCSSIRLHFPQYIEKYYEHKSKIIPNSISISDNNYTDKENIILYVGRVNEDPKQIGLLIDAFNILSCKFPDWKLFLCGEEEVEYSKCNKNIVFLGKTDNVPFFYKKSSIFVNPSSTEGFGNSILEALNYNIPCIIMDSNLGSQNIVHDGYNGIVSSPDNLVRSIDCLIRDVEYRNYLSHNCRKSIARYSDNIWLPVWRKYIEQTYLEFK